MDICMKNAVNKISNLYQDYNALFKTCATNKKYLNLIFKSYWFLYMVNVNTLYQASFFLMWNTTKFIKIVREDILDICEVENTVSLNRPNMIETKPWTKHSDICFSYYLNALKCKECLVFLVNSKI